MGAHFTRRNNDKAPQVGKSGIVLHELKGQCWYRNIIIYTVGKGYGIFGKHSRTLVFHILICYNDNHKQVFLTLMQLSRVVSWVKKYEIRNVWHKR